MFDIIGRDLNLGTPKLEDIDDYFVNNDEHK
jgi:hypothetical protein